MRYNVPLYIEVEANTERGAISQAERIIRMSAHDAGERERLLSSITVGDDPYFVEELEEDLLAVAGRMYDPERHDPDSVFFDDSYTGPSERELMGGCNRCGGLDDCYCCD